MNYLIFVFSTLTIILGLISFTDLITYIFEVSTRLFFLFFLLTVFAIAIKFKFMKKKPEPFKGRSHEI